MDQRTETAIHDIVVAIARTSREATLVELKDLTSVEEMPSVECRATLDALDAGTRERLSDLGGWPEAWSLSRARLIDAAPDVLDLPEDDQRLLARVLPATLLAAAELTEGEPTVADVSRAKEICDAMEGPRLLIGRRPTLLEAAGLMGMRLVPGEEAHDEAEG